MNRDPTPDSDLAKAIDSSFGSLDSFKEEMTDAGKTVFGSGWVSHSLIALESIPIVFQIASFHHLKQN